MRVNKVIKYFVFSDLALFAGWGFVAPLLSVFVIERIAGATLFTVGASAGIYWIARAIIQPPLALALDKKDGEKDDLYVLIIGLVAIGASVIVLPHIETIVHLYIYEAVNGLAFGMYSVPWAAIFSRHLDKNRFAFDWSLDRATLGASVAVASFIGGGLADKLGFTVPFTAAGILAIISAFIVFLTPELSRRPRKKDNSSGEAEIQMRGRGLPTNH
jgi:MFS family permease